jgi:acetyl-CoA acyltransferase
VVAVRDVVIVEAVRTPVGRRNGRLKGIHAVELAAKSLREVVRRPGLDPARVDQVLWGCVSQVGEQAFNVARWSLLQAGYPIEVPGTTVDFQCGSSQQAVHLAHGLIAAGQADVIVAGGVEAMSRVPMFSTIQNGPGEPWTDEIKEQYLPVPQGISAEEIAERWHISRQELDAYSLESHQKAAAATRSGFFKPEIVPVTVALDDGTTAVVVDADEGIRYDTSLEKLAGLKPSFLETGVVTAGNSSQISDGSAAILLMGADTAKSLGLRARARIVAQVVLGVDPHIMLTGPIPATWAVLAKAGLRLDQIDRIEINEAFASVVLAWQKELKPDMSRVNMWGGAIALGHPLGATGARLMTSLLSGLEQSGGRYGLQTMCCGGGMGTGTIIERL